jgi:hypothetical protein
MKNKIICISILTSITLISICSCQTKEKSSINLIDSSGNKQGVWIKHITTSIIDTMFYIDNKLNGTYRSYFVKTKLLRFSGEYKNDSMIGVWKFYDLNSLWAEELDRGINHDSVKNESRNWIIPKYYSIIQLFDKDKGYKKSEGKMLYNDTWESDSSNEHGLWLYFNSQGDTIDRKYFEYGKEIKK